MEAAKCEIIVNSIPMSRLRRFAQSLISGYVQLGANIAYTLVTVRLALHYLPQGEFGLWASIAQLAQYIALVDFGFSGSASRILVDYKDRRDSGEYGSTISTIGLVGVAQAFLILLVGTGLAIVVGPLLRIPEGLEEKFVRLMVGQVVITAAVFATQTLGFMLAAHQRYDFSNYGGALGFVANGAAMWIGFSHGAGVYSLLWGQAAGFLCLLSLWLAGCWRLGLFPGRGEWGKPSRERFVELFSFGRDIFLFAVGNQFINASQTLLVTRLFGLEAAAVWNVCTRFYLVLVQLISRVFDYSASTLAEMMVRQEREKLLGRFRDIVVLTVNMAVVCGLLLAVCNGPFVELWTKGGIAWTAKNDFLLGIWLVVGSTVRVHTGLVGQTKSFRFLRYLYFLEGSTFVGLTLLLHRLDGMTLMLLLSVACSLCFSFPYGLRRTCEYYNLAWCDLAKWHRETLRLAVGIVPAGLAVWFLTRKAAALDRLIVDFLVLGGWSGWMFLRYGLSDSLHREAFNRVPPWGRRILLLGPARAMRGSKSTKHESMG